MVEPHVQVPLAVGVDHRPDEVAPGGGVRRLVVGELAVPEGEAFVVLRGDDEVLHARLVGKLGPELRVIQVGVKVLEVLLVFLVGDLLDVLDPFMPRGEGISAPVDEHAEAVVGEPTAIANGRSD